MFCRMQRPSIRVCFIPVPGTSSKMVLHPKKNIDTAVCGVVATSRFVLELWLEDCHGRQALQVAQTLLGQSEFTTKF